MHVRCKYFFAAGLRPYLLRIEGIKINLNRKTNKIHISFAAERERMQIGRYIREISYIFPNVTVHQLKLVCEKLACFLLNMVFTVIKSHSKVLFERIDKRVE